MLWYMMAAALMAALTCLTIGATKLPTAAVAAIDVAALAWLAAVGCCALAGW